MKSIRSLTLITCISFVILVCQTQKAYSGWGPSPTHDWITGVPYGLPGTGFDDDKFLDRYGKYDMNRQTKIRAHETAEYDQDRQQEQNLDQKDSGDELKTLAIIFAIACGIFMFIMSRTSISGPRR